MDSTSIYITSSKAAAAAFAEQPGHDVFSLQGDMQASWATLRGTILADAEFLEVWPNVEDATSKRNQEILAQNRVFWNNDILVYDFSENEEEASIRTTPGN